MITLFYYLSIIISFYPFLSPESISKTPAMPVVFCCIMGKLNFGCCREA